MLDELRHVALVECDARHAHGRGCTPSGRTPPAPADAGFGSADPGGRREQRVRVRNRVVRGDVAHDLGVQVLPSRVAEHLRSARRRCPSGRCSPRGLSAAAARAVPRTSAPAASCRADATALGASASSDQRAQNAGPPNRRRDVLGMPSQHYGLKGYAEPSYSEACSSACTAAGRSAISSPGACSSSHATSSGAEALARAVGARRDHHPLEALVRDQLAQRVADAAAALDARVDRDPGAARALLDRLEQRQRRRTRGQRRVERQVHRHEREVHRHQRRAVDAREAQRGVEPALGEPLAGEREHDSTHRVAAAQSAAAAARARSRQRPPARPRSAHERAAQRDDDRRAVLSAAVRRSSRRVRSATIRTSTPGQPRSRRKSSAGCVSRCQRAARRGRPSGCRWCRARARRASRPRRRRRPPRRSSCAPSTEASRRSASSCSRPRRSALAPGRAHHEHVELGAEPLRRAPRATHDPLGAAASSVTSASSRSAIACGAAVLRAAGPRAGARRGVAHQALDLDLLGDLAQRGLAQRREVLDLEEVVERRRDALGAGRSCRRAAARSAPPG